MTTLYRPVRIETPEQAEALPVGTVVLSSDHQECAEAADFGPSTPSVRAKRYEPECPYYSEWDGAIPATDVVGGTALVPIEAVDQHRVVWAEPDPHTSSPMPQEDAREIVALRDPWEPDAHIESRLVTPWKPLTGTTDPGEDADALADCGDQA